MSKKKFINGLESLMGEVVEDAIRDGNPFLMEGHDEDVAVKTKPKTSKRKGKRSGKTFTSDLDSLFEDALRETIQEKAKNIAKGISDVDKATKRRQRKPLTGIDSLIRSTATEEDMQVYRSAKKRVTFTFESEKLKRLKSIAKTEKSYLKDILNDVVTEFIEKYERKEAKKSRFN